jgi:hypothetical protein
MYSDLIKYLKKNFFADNWFNYNEIVKTPHTFTLLEIKINNAAKAICDYFTLQLLNGNYIDHVGRNFQEDTFELIVFLGSISPQQDENLKLEQKEKELYARVLKAIQDSFTNKIINLLYKVVFPPFSTTIKEIDNQLELENYYKLTTVKNSISHHVTDTATAPNIELFIIAIELVQIEHFEFKYNRETISKLHQIRKRLEKIRNEKNIVFPAEPLLVKATVLFKKYLYRNNSEDNQGRTERFIATLENATSESITLENTPLASTFKDWEERISCQYEVDKFWKNQNKNFVKKINLKVEQGQKLSTSDIHCLTKNYKDISKDETRIERLLTQFNQTKSKSLFDRYSEKINESYIFNNYISCSLAKKENKAQGHSFEELEAISTDIQNHQNTSNISNFFPWQKLSIHICNNLEKLSQRLFERETFSQFVENLNLLNKTIEEWKTALEWSIDKNYLPFQNSRKDCLSTFKFPNYFAENNDQLFFFTSYILPSNYSFYNYEYQKIESKQKKFDTLKEVYKEIKFVVDEVRANSQKVNNSERRSIEVLAIFSAIALFTIGSIQILPAEALKKDINFFYNFLLSYGYSLALFSLIIWIITRENIKKVHWIHWVIISILAVSSALFINNMMHNPIFKFKHEEPIDSDNSSPSNP